MANPLPRWRGFNLTEMFTRSRQAPFRESDFEWIRDWGFDFARLSVSYRCWTPDPRRWREIDDTALGWLDQAVAWGAQYGVHINVNLHRAPGHCVNTLDEEPFDLWRDDEALEACAFQLRLLTERWQHIPSAQLSLNPLNEPMHPAQDDVVRVYRRLISDIRAVDPHRQIIIDGPRWARVPIAELVDTGVAQAYHAYDPIQVCFWRWPSCPGSMDWPMPTWPMTITDPDPNWNGHWDAAEFDRRCLTPWHALAAQGIGIHVSEIACMHHTPHPVMLAWYRDLLRLFTRAGWGWALWNLRGTMGVVDSQRPDFDYEPWRGHLLDRRLLDCLQSDGAST